MHKTLPACTTTCCIHWKGSTPHTFVFCPHLKKSYHNKKTETDAVRTTHFALLQWRPLQLTAGDATWWKTEESSFKCRWDHKTQTMGPNRTPVQWVPDVFHWGKTDGAWKLTNYLDRFRICNSVPPFSHIRLHGVHRDSPILLLV